MYKLNKNICPICESDRINKFSKDKQREYFICSQCNLIYVPDKYFISEKEEKARYDLHNNNFENKGYVKFLERLLTPMNKILSPKSNGLNYGSGPEPVLSIMFEKQGHNMTNYDPFYTKKIENCSNRFDFITLTEVVEHFYYPKKEFEKIQSLLKPGGIIGIMTKLTDNVNNFSKWYYKNDKTHVCFYSKETFKFIAKKIKATPYFIKKDDVILMFSTNIS